MFLALPCRNTLDANRSRVHPLAFSAVSPYARIMCSHPLLQSVFQNLSAIIKTGSLHFLLACSGGADSTALLLAFHQLKPRLSCRLTVISVNHNIRSPQESAADSAFVESSRHILCCCRKNDSIELRSTVISGRI